MIPNREGWQWQYLGVKKLSALIGDFYCLNCLHSFKTKNKLELHKKVCENKDFCYVIMLSEDTTILEFNQYWKYDKAPFIIYTDLECMIEKIEICKNKPEHSSATKVSRHISSGFSMSKIYHLKAQKISIMYSGKDRVKNFCEYLRELDHCHYTREYWGAHSIYNLK